MKTDIETRYIIARILGMEDFDFYLIQALDTIEDQYYQAMEEGADADAVFKLYDIRAALLQARNSYADFKNQQRKTNLRKNVLVCRKKILD